MKDWRTRCKKFGVPLLPCAAAQAAAWLGGRPRRRIGFSAALVRKAGSILVRVGGQTVQRWPDPR